MRALDSWLCIAASRAADDAPRSRVPLLDLCRRGAGRVRARRRRPPQPDGARDLPRGARGNLVAARCARPARVSVAARRHRHDAHAHGPRRRRSHLDRGLVPRHVRAPRVRAAARPPRHVARHARAARRRLPLVLDARRRLRRRVRRRVPAALHHVSRDGDRHARAVPPRDGGRSGGRRAPAARRGADDRHGRRRARHARIDGAALRRHSARGGGAAVRRALHARAHRLHGSRGARCLRRARDRRRGGDACSPPERPGGRERRAVPALARAHARSFRRLRVDGDAAAPYGAPRVRRGRGRAGPRGRPHASARAGGVPRADRHRDDLRGGAGRAPEGGRRDSPR